MAFLSFNGYAQVHLQRPFPCRSSRGLRLLNGFAVLGAAAASAKIGLNIACSFWLGFLPFQVCDSCPWSGRLTPFARPGQGLFCIPLSFCPARAVVLHQYHTSYPLYAGRDFVEVLTKCRAQHFFRGKDRFVAAGGSVKQQDEGLGISPISVLLAEPVANLK